MKASRPTDRYTAAAEWAEQATPLPGARALHGLAAAAHGHYLLALAASMPPEPPRSPA